MLPESEIGPPEKAQIGITGYDAEKAPSAEATCISLDAAWLKKLLGKIDKHLLPVMTISYMIQFLDKQTLSQASIMGIVQDLSLVGNEFSWTGSIFYFGYLAGTYPMSMLMVRFPIGKFLAICFLLWGTVLACHAATHNFTGLMIVRFFLGAAESCVSPGFSLMTGMWYRREEQPLRHGIWFTGNSIAVMFGGLLGYAIAHINSGLAAWKWLFLIYAIITIVWSGVLWFLLPDGLTTAKFLSEDERVGAIERIKVNQTGAVNHEVKWDQVKEALCDYKIWMLFFFQMANNIPNGAITTFSGLILAGFGFTTLQVYLLIIPQGVVHAMFALSSTYLAGRFPKARCGIIAVCSLISLIGCVIIFKTENQGARLFSFYLFTSFASGLPLSMSLVSSNVAGYTKKATVSAMLFIAYCAGNIIGPFLFFSNEAPKYTSGFLSLIICLPVAIVIILSLGFCWKWENESRDKRKSEQELSNGQQSAALGKDAGGRAFDQDMTDGQNPAFRYVH